MLLKRFYCFICLDDGPEQKKYLLFYRTLKNMRTKTASTVLVLCTVVVARVVYYSYYLVDLLLVPTSSSAPSLSSTVVLETTSNDFLFFKIIKTSVRPLGNISLHVQLIVIRLC